jgi:DNA-binding MarR family transcriptional regulator
VRKGLVVRSENVDDRRRSDIALTPYGSGLQSELVPFAMKIIARATSGVPPEDLETTLRTLKAFNRNLTSPNS